MYWKYSICWGVISRCLFTHRLEHLRGHSLNYLIHEAENGANIICRRHSTFRWNLYPGFWPRLSRKDPVIKLLHLIALQIVSAQCNSGAFVNKHHTWNKVCTYLSSTDRFHFGTDEKLKEQSKWFCFSFVNIFKALIYVYSCLQNIHKMRLFRAMLASSTLTRPGCLDRPSPGSSMWPWRVRWLSSRCGMRTLWARPPRPTMSVMSPMWE